MHATKTARTDDSDAKRGGLLDLNNKIKCFVQGDNGVADGARTHDNRNHNPGLYQLSYSHH